MSDHHGENNPHFKHGGKGTKLYEVWCTMRARCTREKDERYKWYGARGISVCEEWNDFAVFRKWAYENEYSEGLTIDRIDNNGNYAPSNCRWATVKQQNNNTSKTTVLLFRGESKTLHEWAEKFSIHPEILRQRLYSGWSVEDALLQPINGEFAKTMRSSRGEKRNQVCALAATEPKGGLDGK